MSHAPEHAQPKHHMVSFSTYVMVWVALLMLTALTIVTASMHFGAFSIVAAIIIATIKGTLVLLYFMNLRYEERIFLVMLGVALLTLAVIMVLTFVDVLFR
jgi:cytochrome c oxidase subunit 4